jgi:hypothetical protein
MIALCDQGSSSLVNRNAGMVVLIKCSIKTAYHHEGSRWNDAQNQNPSQTITLLIFSACIEHQLTYNSSYIALRLL